MANSTFNFHGLVGLNVHSPMDYVHRFFRSEYGWAASDQLPTSQITLNWDHSLAPFLQPEAGFYHQHKIAARWRYRLEVQPESVEIRGRGNALALTMVHHMLIHPSLRLLASRQGVILLHGAGLVLNGSSLIFTGVGGSGKTTSTSLLLDQGKLGWRLHADDYTFISEEAETYAYLTRAHLYRDLLAWLPRLSDRLNRTQSIKLALNNLLLQASVGHVRWAVRLPLKRLWPNREESMRGNLAGLLVLRRGLTAAPTLAPVTNLEDLLGELLAMNRYEARHFLRLLQKSLPSDLVESLVEDWQQRERQILTAALAKGRSYWLDLPSFPPGDQLAGPRIEAVLADTFGVGR